MRDEKTPQRPAHPQGLLVGARGFEPPTSCTPCKRASRTAPRPDDERIIVSFPRTSNARHHGPGGYNENVKIDSQRTVDPISKPDDRVDHALRPRTLAELIGQTQLKENLQILIAASRQRGEAV